MGLGLNQPRILNLKPSQGNVQVIVRLQRVQCGRIVHAFYDVVVFCTLRTVMMGANVYTMILQHEPFHKCRVKQLVSRHVKVVRTSQVQIVFLALALQHNLHHAMIHRHKFSVIKMNSRRVARKSVILHHMNAFFGIMLQSLGSWNFTQHEIKLHGVILNAFYCF